MAGCFLITLHGPVAVARQDQLDSILNSVHTDQFGGHLGVNKMFYKISERFYWVGMSEDIRDFKSRCLVCQKQDRLYKAPSVLHQVAVKTKPFSQVGMDLIGPLKETDQGFKYICVLTDYLTKWPEAKPLKSKTASEVYLFFVDFICSHGFPEVLITDQGREFCNSLNESICSHFQVQHRVATACHPQTNGLTERFNQTLCDMIVMYVNEDQLGWADRINPVLLAYRTAARQEAIRSDPFFLVYGYKARLAVELDMPLTFVTTRVDDADRIKTRANEKQHLRDARKLALHSIGEAQVKMKSYYASTTLHYILMSAVLHYGNSSTSGHYKAVIFEEASPYCRILCDNVVTIKAKTDVVNNICSNCYILIFKAQSCSPDTCSESLF